MSQSAYLAWDAVFSLLHFAIIFALVAVLTAQLVLCRAPITPELARRLSRFDLVYGLSALALLVVGGVRAAQFAKGWAYYSQSLAFWTKMFAFLLVATLSIYPTMSFIMWRKQLGLGRAIDSTSVQKVRRFVHFELSLFVVIAAAAVLMARGM